MLKWTIALILAAVCAGTVKGQTAANTTKPAEPKTFYQLTFVVKELNGERVVNTRTYYTSATTHGLVSSIRAEERVPFATTEGATPQWQQISVGVSVDSRELELIGDRISLRVTASVDSLAAQQEKNIRQPVIRSNRWDALVIVPLKRPTVIFSSDDPFSTQKIQLQLTVAPL